MTLVVWSDTIVDVGTMRRFRKYIYTVTVVNGDPNERDTEKRLRSRCWGYHFKKADAEYVIDNNATDISELGYYRYGVLSRIGEGPMPSIMDEVQWYEFIWNWNVAPREHDGIVIPEFVEAKPIKKPEMYQQILFAGLSLAIHSRKPQFHSVLSRR